MFSLHSGLVSDIVNLNYRVETTIFKGGKLEVNVNSFVHVLHTS